MLLLSNIVRNCNAIAFDNAIPYINDPNIPNDAGQVPLIEAIDCIKLNETEIEFTGDHIFRELLNNSKIDRQTTPPPLIPLMAGCIWTLVPEVLKFNDTVVNFKGTKYTEHEFYLHDYVKKCHMTGYNLLLSMAEDYGNRGFTGSF